MPFELNPRLAKGCTQLGQHRNCQILLKNNAHYAWILIIPEVEASIIDLHQLDAETYSTVCELQLTLSSFIEKNFGSYKLNTACIGNVVEQLHIHLVGRNINTDYQQGEDPAWPAPVWGHAAKLSYSEKQIADIEQAFQQQLPAYSL